MRDAPPAPEPLPVPIVDSHCHLDLLDVPAAQAADAAHAAGVTRLITVGVDVASSEWQVRTAESLAHVWAAIAIHPNDAGRGAAGSQALAALEKLAASPVVRAIGETGLDYYRTGEEGHAAQEASLRAHVQIARAAGLPVMVHDRDAHDDVLRILAEEQAPAGTVFHCFSGDVAMAREAASRGYLLSFAGNLTFRNAQGLRDAAAAVPLEALLVETDSPFLTPVPYRGAPNSPAQVALTARALAEVRGQDLAEVCAAVSANAERVFGPL